MAGWQELSPSRTRCPACNGCGASSSFVGVFKPNPQVYRYAARILSAEPGQLLMVSSNSFDVVGARASGYRGAYVNRYDLLYDETPYRFDIEARDFLEMAAKLGCK